MTLGVFWKWKTSRIGADLLEDCSKPGQAAALPSPLLAVPNVTAHRSTASVLITVLLYDGLLLCGFNVAIKGLIAKLTGSYPNSSLNSDNTTDRCKKRHTWQHCGLDSRLPSRRSNQQKHCWRSSVWTWPARAMPQNKAICWGFTVTDCTIVLFYIKSISLVSSRVVND